MITRKLDELLEILLIPYVITYSDAFMVEEELEEDRRGILSAYLSPALRFHIIGDYMLDIMYEEKFQAMVDHVIKYRKRVNRDEEFIQAALECEYIQPGITRYATEHPLSAANIGVFLSNNTRDRKFVLKELRRYYNNMTRGLFPLLPRSSFNRTNICHVLVAKEANKVNRMILPQDVPPISFKSDILYADRLEKAKCIHMSMAYDSAFLEIAYGDESGTPAKKDLFPGKLSSAEFPKALKCCHSYLTSISLCAPQYRSALCESSLADYENNKEGTALNKIAHEITIIMDEAEVMHSVAVEAVMVCEQQSADLNRQIAELRAQLADAQSQRQSMDMSNDLKEKLAEASKRMESLAKQVDYQSRKIEGLTEENAALSSKLAAARANNTALNRQLIDAYEENGRFYEEDETIEQSQAPSLREKLGKETIDMLAGKKVILAGGFHTTHNILRSMFPHWGFIENVRSAQKKPASLRADVIVLMLSNCSHRTAICAQSIARTSNVETVPCLRNSPLGVCERLRDFFAERD